MFAETIKYLPVATNGFGYLPTPRILGRSPAFNACLATRMTQAPVAGGHFNSSSANGSFLQ